MKHSRDKNSLTTVPQNENYNWFVEKNVYTACKVFERDWTPEHPTCNIIFPHIASMTPPKFEAMRDIREYCLDDICNEVLFHDLSWILFCTE